MRDHFTNCSRLASELEVGVRTIIRDIEAMRNEDYPIDYDSRRRAYFYREPVYNLPSMHVTASDLLALRVASAALKQNEGTPFYRRLTRIYRILLNGLRWQQADFSRERINAAFSFYHVGVGTVATDVFETLTKAVLRSHEIEFNYRKPTAMVAELHRVWPYFIASRDNLFYLVAQEPEKPALKLFAITRIESPVRLTGRSFTRVKKLSLRNRFMNSFRCFGGAPPRHLKLRISQRAAPFIRERRWHASQKIDESTDGSIMLELNVSDIRDVQSWILRWGSDVEVLEPPDLREAIARTTKAMAAIYG